MFFLHSSSFSSFSLFSSLQGCDRCVLGTGSARFKTKFQTKNHFFKHALMSAIGIGMYLLCVQCVFARVCAPLCTLLRCCFVIFSNLAVATRGVVGVRGMQSNVQRSTVYCLYKCDSILHWSIAAVSGLAFRQFSIWLLLIVVPRGCPTALWRRAASVRHDR